MTNTALAFDDVEPIDERRDFSFPWTPPVMFGGGTGPGVVSGAAVFSCEDVYSAAPSMYQGRLKIDRLAALVAGWNGPHSRPPAPHALATARELLQFVPPRSIPFMSVVPTNDGGVQLEWHAAGVDVEVGIDPRGAVDCAVEGHGFDSEGDLPATLLPVLRALALIA